MLRLPGLVQTRLRWEAPSEGPLVRQGRRYGVRQRPMETLFCNRTEPPDAMSRTGHSADQRTLRRVGTSQCVDGRDPHGLFSS
jgi:hypothetical protein